MQSYQQLKAMLQSFGALRPHAWERILQFQTLTFLKEGETFIRTQGTLAIILTGLIKEYDPNERKKPSIISFLSENQALLTRKHNQSHFLKACLPTTLIHWDYEKMQVLYREYPELKIIYDGILGDYDHRLIFRMRLLELPVPERLATFRLIFEKILPYLKRKDLANYLHLNYSHFIRLWNS